MCGPRWPRKGQEESVGSDVALSLLAGVMTTWPPRGRGGKPSIPRDGEGTKHPPVRGD